MFCLCVFALMSIANAGNVDEGNLIEPIQSTFSVAVKLVKFFFLLLSIKSTRKTSQNLSSRLRPTVKYLFTLNERSYFNFRFVFGVFIHEYVFQIPCVAIDMQIPNFTRSNFKYLVDNESNVA